MSLTVGTLSAILDLDADPFTKAYERALGKTEQDTAKRMQSMGGKLTKSVTLPIVAAGTAAVKLGTDFDTTFSRMVGLAGVPKAEIDALKDSVLGLAGRTAQAPQELADALYDAASAGLDSKQAMAAVEVAARGAASGLGSTGDIVGLVASATASYGAANIDAATAVDILTATIRAGRADPAELAGTLGRVLPIASKLGITFDEVGGAVAYLSNTFGDTNRTVTAVQGLFTKLFSQTAQGRQALEDMGTSSEELAERLAEGGLMGALELLREKGFAENQRAMAMLFDDMEGRSAAMALLADESGSLADVLAETANSAGALNDAFAASDTDGKTMKQALVDLQVAAIKAGDVLAPFVATVASGIGTVADAFASLPGPAQTVIITMAGVVASVGPLMSIGGKLAANWRQISNAFETVALKAMYAKDAMPSLGTALGAVGFVAAAAGAAYLANSLNDVKVDVDGLATALGSLDAETEGQMHRFIAAASAFGDLDEVVRKLADSNVVAAERFIEQAEAAGITGDELTALKAIVDSKRASDVQAAKDQKQYADEMAGAVGPTEDLTAAQEEQKAAIDATIKALEGYEAQLKAMFDPLFAMQDAIAAEEQARKDLTAAIKEHGPASEEAERATDELTRAMVDSDAAALSLQRAVEAGDVSIDEFRTTLARWVEQGRITADQAVALEGKVATLTTTAEGYAGAYEGVFTADTSQAEAQIDRLVRKALDAAARVAGNIITLQGFGSGGGGGGTTSRSNPPRRAMGGPVWAGQAFLVGEEGPELVSFPSSGMVRSASETDRMLGAAGSRGALDVRVFIGDQELRGLVRSEVRDENGRVVSAKRAGRAPLGAR